MHDHSDLDESKVPMNPRLDEVLRSFMHHEPSHLDHKCSS